MERLTAKRILDIALDAADRATVNSEEHDLTVKEMGLLNEQWTQSYVGDAISRELRRIFGGDGDRPFVTYETSVSWLDHFFKKHRGPGRIPGGLSERQRFDITVWPMKRPPLGLIEIKNEPIMSAYSRRSDAKKLHGALRRWTSLRWGIFLFCTRNNTSKKGDAVCEHLEKLAEDTFSAIREVIGKSAHISTETSKMVRQEGRQMMWAGVIITRKP